MQDEEIYMYYNGCKASPEPTDWSENMGTNTGEVVIGGSPFNGHYAHFRLDNFLVWYQALTDQDVRNIYAQGGVIP